MDIKDLKKNWDAFSNEDAMYAIYSLRSGKDHGWDKDKFFKTGEEDARMFVDVLKKYNGNFDKVLDFGCGIGRVTQGLCNYFKESHGVEIKKWEDIIKVV